MKRTIFLGGLVVLFFVTRLLALSQLYHQDEYKWAMIVNPVFHLNLESEHPPLVALFYRATGVLAGFDHLRLLPIFLSLFVVFLAYLLARRLYGERAALWSLAFLLPNTYFLIASNQVDIDGIFLPLTTLCAVYAYYRIDFGHPEKPENRPWFFWLFIAVVFGFLVKLSFILVLGALATEWWLTYRPNLKRLATAVGAALLSAVVTGALIVLINKLYGISNPTEFISHAEGFKIFNFGSRHYSQLLFLSVKAAVVASPILLAPYVLFLFGKELWQRYRFWLIFFLYNFLFYFFIFDFTDRTIERYLMFLIVPSALIAGSIFADSVRFAGGRKSILRFVLTGIAAAAATTFFVTHSYFILPLNPKSAYLWALKHLHFNFLIPVTGGSGPVGFYVLVSFILYAFVIGALGLLLFRFVRRVAFKEICIAFFLFSGLFYNLTLDAEYLSGFRYGSVNTVAKELVGAVVNDPAVPAVVTYYDTGGYELNATGKYAARFYTDPMFAKGNVTRFTSYRYYMVVDFPEIDKNSVYWKYFETCYATRTVRDRSVSGYLFDCENGDRSLFAPVQ